MRDFESSSTANICRGRYNKGEVSFEVVDSVRYCGCTFLGVYTRGNTPFRGRDKYVTRELFFMRGEIPSAWRVSLHVWYSRAMDTDIFVCVV